MAEQENTPVQQDEELHYIPASPVKRAMAWLGVVYMVIITALSTYHIYTGTALNGLAPLLAVPGLVGLGIISQISHKTAGRPGKGAALVLSILCWVLATYLLLPGIAGLMSNFA